MLLLGRNEGDEIVIGEPGDVLTERIVIKLIRVGVTSRIGIEAQKDMRILRGELVEENGEQDARKAA